MKPAFKVLMWAVLGPLVVLLLLLAAWIASNGRWADVAPRPVPPELQPQAVTLAPQDNAFFDMQGLWAPEGESPNAWGQRMWRGDAERGATLLAAPSGAEWDCKAGSIDCLAHWRASAATLTAQMTGSRTLGERCRALATRTAFQEPAPMRRARSEGAKPFESLPLPQLSPVSNCMRWLHVEAVLAQDAQQAHAAWARADALLRLFASGSQTLIGQVIAWSWITRHQQLLAQWSAQQPAGHALPAAWLAPLPSRVLQPRVWMVAESHFQRESIADMREHGMQMFGTAPNSLQAFVGRYSLGYLPELTAQATEASWLADLRLYGHLQGPALVHAARSKDEPDAPWWRSLHWRNTVGQILVEVGRPGFEQYTLRQADLVLYQAALDASQQLNAVPAAERADWWARQPLDASIRERLSLSGDAILVRTWRGETQAANATPVRFPLRPA